MRSFAARAEAQLPALNPERILELDRLGRRGERVRHRDVDAARAVRMRAGALAAPDGLVVREVLVSESEVVLRPLPCGRYRNELDERREDHVDDARGGI